ncbi:MAG: septum formation initiator family protein [Clostridia bacterium]|nr:septum formation initiator family protein [Clostridia bacterium]
MESKKKRRVPVVVKVALFCFALYAAISLIHLQVKISEKGARIAQLDAEIQKRTTQNEALRSVIDKGASDDDIAAIARDKLGYAYPQERVFVDASSQ